MNCPAMPPGGGRGMKFRKPFSPMTRKNTPARYRAINEAILITGSSFAIAPLYGVKYIDDNRIDLGILQRGCSFYDPKQSRNGPRLASDDEGDARPDQVRSRWHCRDRARPIGFRRAGSPAEQRAFARQYD